jgi:uncharacterized protein (TIGR02466 family)
MSYEERYHHVQNGESLFWSSPSWKIKTKFDSIFNTALLDELHDIAKDIKSGKDKNPHNSIWDYDKPCLNILNQEIINIVTQTVFQNLPEIKQLKIVGCEHFTGWMNIVRPGESLNIHGHVESAMTATYYIKVKDECGDLVLYDTSKAIDWTKNTLSDNPTLKEIRYNPVEGELIFFPSYMLHGVSVNKSDDLRISISTDLRKITEKSSNKINMAEAWGGMESLISNWKKKQENK